MTRSLFIFFCITLLVVPVRAEEICDRELLMGWESWPPYQYVDEKGILTGIDIELAKLVFGYAGCQLAFVELPWKRHISDLEHGRVDIASGASYTEDRAKIAYFPTAYRQERVSLFVLKSHPSADKYTDLETFFSLGGTLGLTLGYYYGPEIESMLESPSYQAVTTKVRSDPQLFQMLMMKRIAGFIADPYSVAARSAVYPEVDSFRRLFDVYRADIHFMLSKKSISSAQHDAINRLLEELKSNNVLDDFIRDYRFVR
ncbi:MAG: transporter substrate-binding domain-containing protein [Hahellaceae bacterium]|nr:transporter substrate-binding domain-containing protein [Hahellaceae bacterium]MCP5209959.1 transporter substrate-binding domain-containing protein [Hahellaceae bacterium]